MGKILFIAVGAILFVAMTSGHCKSPQSETGGLKMSHSKPPEGFRDLKWGQPPTADMAELESSVAFRSKPHPVLPDPAESTRYIRRPTDKLYFGDTKITDLAYGFYKNRFCSVGFGSDESLLAVLTKMYGEPGGNEELRNDRVRRVTWVWKDIWITYIEPKAHIEVRCDIYWISPEHLELFEKEKLKHLETKRK
jgi:hypothetical protein